MFYGASMDDRLYRKALAREHYERHELDLTANVHPCLGCDALTELEELDEGHGWCRECRESGG